MALSRQQKEDIVTKLNDILKKNETVAFVNFKGLGVENTTAMRRQLADNGVGYMVAKKNLIKRALADKKVGGEMPELEGELALSYGSSCQCCCNILSCIFDFI